MIIHLQASLLVLEQNGSKLVLHRGLGSCAEDPSVTGAYFEKFSANLRLKVLFIYFYLEMIEIYERGAQRVVK